MFNEKYQLYSRGFLGSVVGIKEQASELDTLFKTLRSIQYNQRVEETKNKLAFNEEIEVLYSHYVKGSINTGTFNFHDAIIQCALKAFGNYYFTGWLQAQSHSPLTTSIHSDFLKDTLHFINTGKRNMLIENWLPLLDSKVQASDFADITKDENYISLFSYDNIESKTLKEVIKKWCRNKNGINDLLVTLHVLFGN